MKPKVPREERWCIFCNCNCIEDEINYLIDCPFLLWGTAAFQHERGHNSYLALLDARKAFDNVWTAGLFHKLYTMGINGKLWRLLVNWYSDIKCCVRIGTTVSEFFKLLQGVFQGGKWSMRLFEIFYDSLLRRVSIRLKGSNIYSIRAPCPTYGDDLALTAPYQSTL